MRDATPGWEEVDRGVDVRWFVIWRRQGRLFMCGGGWGMPEVPFELLWHSPTLTRSVEEVLVW